MHIEQLQDLIYDVASRYFQGATVIWAEQINTEPKVPYVTLKLGDVNRDSFPLRDDEYERHFQCRVPLEINLYTKGKATRTQANATINYANTATSDLMGFCNYVDSEEMTDYITTRGADFELMLPVKDLSRLENDRRFRYRAMAEFSVHYTEQAGGLYGVYGVSLPSSSGGGTTEMANAQTHVIEDVEITEKEKEEKA